MKNMKSNWWIAGLITVLFTTTASPNKPIVVSHLVESSDCEQMYELPAGWSMLSLACEVENSSLEALFPTAISLFEFVPNSGYQKAQSLEAGKGYWINIPEPTTILVTGLPLSSCILEPPTGWSMIGPCSFSASVSDLQIATGGNLVSVFGFNTGYYLANILNPGQGYWVQMTSAGVLVLDGSESESLGEIEILGTILDDNGEVEITGTIDPGGEGEAEIIGTIE